MNPIIQLIMLTLSSKTISPKNDLKRKEEGFVDKHYSTILSILFLILAVLCMCLFLAICFHIGGTESGHWYNNHSLA